MTRKELNLAIFEGTAKSVLWQPRLETWISHHRECGTMPAVFKEMDDLEIYDALGCSVRYAASAGLESYEIREEMVTVEERHPEHTVRIVRTPLGELRTVERVIWKNGRVVNSRIEEFAVKSVEDLKVLTDLINRQQFCANLPAFERAVKKMGSRGEPTIYLSSSGFTDLIKWWSGLENGFYLLYDHPREVEVYLEACERRDERMLDAALQLPCRIFNLGDHATNEFTPPPILKKYLIPRWQRIAERLHKEGRFVHSHWDGNARLILPFLKETNLDGVEALTPAPMGDITIKQIKEAVGDKMVLLDLLPAIDFLENYPLDRLLDFTKEVIDTFAPRLILGISDELPPSGQIKKVEAISELVDKICGLAE